MPGIISPADFRYLKEIFRDFGLKPIFVPDYSDTLDGPAWQEYHRIPPGGTPVDEIRSAGRSTTRAPAPALTASAANSCPSARKPVTQKKSAPLVTARLS